MQNLQISVRICKPEKTDAFLQIEMEKLFRRSLAESFSGIIRRKASFDVTGDGPLLPPR
jgi:hypothetical protein